jgi:hypothetical protein
MVSSSAMPALLSLDRDVGITASYIETLLMGSERIEVRSKLPRTLTVLGRQLPDRPSPRAGRSAAASGALSLP